MAERFLVVDREVDGQVRELFSTDVGQLPVVLLEEDDHLHVRIGEVASDEDDDAEDDAEDESEDEAAEEGSRSRRRRKTA